MTPETLVTLASLQLSISALISSSYPSIYHHTQIKPPCAYRQFQPPNGIYGYQDVSMADDRASINQP